MYLVILNNIMAKQRISATIDKKTYEMLKELLRNDEYRNKSHILEKAIKLLWEEKNDKDKR